MGTKTAVVSRIALAWIALVMACSDDPDTGPPGRGSAACNEWQSAYCGMAGKCQSQNANIICEQLKAISCKSDTEAKRCADLMNGTASCMPPSAECDVGAIADPAPAKKMCEDFNAAFCKRSDECQPGSLDTCLQEVRGILKCEEVFGVGLSYESCMTEVPKIACGAQATFPAACTKVFIGPPMQ